MNGVAGRLRHAANALQQRCPADLARVLDRVAPCQFRDRGAAGDGRNTAFRAKTNVRNSVSLQLQREFHDVSTRRIFQRRHRVGTLQFSCISRILEMVEQFSRVHTTIVNTHRAAMARETLPYNRFMPHSPYPRRIACLQPSATVILAGIGELDRVVACTKYCIDVVPELRPDPQPAERPTSRDAKVRESNRRIIGDSWNSKASEILAVAPDFVIAAVPYQEASVVEILKAGIRFLGLAPRTLADIYTDIAIISGAVGAAERGAKVISEMQSAIDNMRQRTVDLRRKRVFAEEWGKPIIASQPWVAELVEAAGGEFLGRPAAQCSAEDIAQMDPEVIVAAWCGTGDRVPLAKIADGRNWANTTAVRNSQIYCVSDELINTPAPTLLAGMRALAGAIHPEVFGTQPGLRPITQVL